MKEISISIIIPVYNVEPYIERCFQSVISQTYRNYEIIFVDDRGTDKSVEILQNLIDEYKGEISIKILHHERNRGLSAARNTGIIQSSGTYLLFVDSDDSIYPTALESLTAPLIKQEYDLIAGLSLIDKSGKFSFSEKVSEKKLPEFQYVYNGMKSPMGLSGTACNHLYRTDFLKKNNIKFKEGILFEDIIFNIEFFCYHPTFTEIDTITYSYFIRKNSITTTCSEKHYEDEIEGFEILEKLFTDHDLLAYPYVRCLIGQRCLRLLIISSDYGEEYFSRTLKYIRKRGFCKNEFSALLYKQKLLYIQLLLPQKIAWLYAKCFVWFYRTFLWRKS